MHYADPLDQATITAERTLEEAIAAALQSKEPVLEATGQCRNCDEPLEEEGLRFCDADCRADYDHRLSRRKVNGH